MEGTTMLWSALLLSLTLNFLFMADHDQVGPGPVTEIVPPARPVFSLLEAVKDEDRERLKTVFSEVMRKRLEKEGWDKVLKSYQKVFRKEFGDYKLEGFTFEYIGGAEKGQVLVRHKGKKLPGLRVIKEQTDWKVNER
jgi:hypothetical protein